MKVAVFSSKAYDRSCLEAANAIHGHELTFFEPRLTRDTYTLASGFPAICAFVNDQVEGTVLRQLTQQGTRLIALRCAGFNNVDLAVAHELGVTVVRVPAYSPHAVAEHTVGLILALNRKIHRAYARVRAGKFLSRWAARIRLASPHHRYCGYRKNWPHRGANYAWFWL